MEMGIDCATRSIDWVCAIKIYNTLYLDAAWGNAGLWCRIYVSGNLINISSGNDMHPKGVKPLPEQMLPYHQLGAREQTSVKIE